MIFGVVILFGIAVFGVISLRSKQISAVKKYDMALTRYNREERITDLASNDNRDE